MEKKEFDAVEIMRKIRDAQYEEMKGKSAEEIVAYYREKSAALEKQIHKLTKRVSSRKQP